MSQVTCPECGRTFSKHGYPRHEGSLKCLRNQDYDEVYEVVQAVRQELKARDKQKISKTAINAFERRGCLEFVGAEKHRTKLLEMSDGSYIRNPEWWVDKWVAALYKVHKEDKSINVYEDVKRLYELPEEQRQQQLDMILLAYAET